MVGMNDQPMISGDNLIHAMDYVKRKKGEEGLNWIETDVGSKLNEIFPEKMYPFEKYTDLLEIIKGNFNDGDSNIISRIGYDRAKTLSFFEYYKKKTDPITIFDMMQKHWEKFNDFASLNIKKNGNSNVAIYICEYNPHPLYCERMVGFLEGIITAVCFRKDAKVNETTCISNGEDYCKFEASWDEPEMV